MLRTPDTFLSQQQQLQQQQQTSKQSKDAKVPGNSINLLKATSKGKFLAFLNPSGRKGNSSSSSSSVIGTDQYDLAQQQLSSSSSIEPPGLSLQHQPQQANNSSQRRGPIHDSLGDANTVEQYKHLFQNRPLNNPPQPQQLQQQQQQQNYQIKRTGSHPNVYLQQQQQGLQQQYHHHHQLVKNSSAEDLYTETEKKLAKDQLWIVRRNIRECSPDSEYFKRFAALVDDWRNFLPRRSSSGPAGTGTATTIVNNNINNNNSKVFRSNNVYSDSEVDSYDVGDDDEYIVDSDMYEEYEEYDSLEEGDEDEEDDDEEDEQLISSYRLPLKESTSFPSINNYNNNNNNNKRLPVNSPSTSPFAKEFLREQDLFKLVSSASADFRNENRPYSSSSSVYNDDRRPVSRIGFVSSRSATANNIAGDNHYEEDEEEASYADAEGYSPDATSRRVGGTSSKRFNTAATAVGAVTRSVRRLRRHASRINEESFFIQQQQQLRSKSTNDIATAGGRYYQNSRLNDVLKASVKQQDSFEKSYNNNNTGHRHRRHYRRRSTPDGKKKAMYHQYATRIGGVRLEDIVRGIETEFSTCFNSNSEESDQGLESEDSLTCLISGYENSGEESLEDESRSNSSSPSPLSSSLSSLSQVESLASQGSTLLNSVSVSSRSDFGEDVQEALQQLLFEYRNGEEQNKDEGKREEVVLPPQYENHRIDHQIVEPVNEEAIRSASTTALAQVMNTTVSAVAAAAAAAVTDKEQGQKEINNNNSHPNLTLQTTTQVMGGIAPGALSAFEKRPIGSQFSLTKCNSTSSLYIDSTMAKSDVDEILRATERIVNSSSYVPSERVTMTQSDIFDFIRFIFDCGQNLGAENAIITLIYVERMTELGNLSFHAINWRRILLGALILSIKVWEDLAVFNSDVCAIFEGLSVKDVNALERFTMAKLQYNVSVKRSLYASCYFRLRDVSEQQHNLHYGKLTFGLSQRDIMMQNNSNGSSTSVASSSTQTHNLTVTNGSNVSSQSNSRSGSCSGSLMGTTITSNNNSIGLNGSSTGSLTGSHFKIPVGPGYRKWTLKPLSVREADRLEARSSLYTSNVMMEVQERKDAGCCLDKYSLATPEELHNLSATLLSSMHNQHATTATTTTSSILASSTATSSTQYGNSQTMSTSSSVSSTATKVSATNLSSGSLNVDDKSTGSELPKRTLRLKKSRSDFFFQNSTPASIM
ncbi:hypothetical protein BGZ46_004261 [Entomortierella lignicola]|nr:hypothetical protein BGZ46_004261 [Entomortierella lignicola]